MRHLICKDEGIQKLETVLLSEREGKEFTALADEIQVPCNSRLWACRITFAYLHRQKEEESRQQKDVTVEDANLVAQDDSDDDFGLDIFDRDAQLRHEERQRLEALEDQNKLEKRSKVQWSAQEASTFSSESSISTSSCLFGPGQPDIIAGRVQSHTTSCTRGLVVLLGLGTWYSETWYSWDFFAEWSVGLDHQVPRRSWSQQSCTQ
jgi:hypothetical protein